MIKEAKIIFEDEDMLVVDKPTGWIVNKADTTGSQPVIQEWLKKFDYPLAYDDAKRGGIVHRLDKETSGVLLIAKNKKSLLFLQEQFKKRLVKKKYLALVHGKLEPVEGSINVPVGRLTWDRKKFGVVPGGRDAYTDYKVKNYYIKGNDNFSLVKFSPKTGRTHQIRIHSKYLNMPIVGDSLYAGRKRAKEGRKWCPRIFLHAESIKFVHPRSKKTVEFNSKLPRDLEKALSELEMLS